MLDLHAVTLCAFLPAETAIDCRVDFHNGEGRLRQYVSQLATLLRTREFDVVHVHSPHLALLFLVVALFVRPQAILRSVLHVHSSYDVLRRRNRWMLLPAFLVFRRVICCSYASRQSFPKLYRFLAGRRLLTIANGMDRDRVDRVMTARQRGVDQRADDLRLVSVGHLRPLKNHETVIRSLAHARARDVRLTIVSDGPSRDSLEQLCRDLSVEDRVEFTGQLTRDEVLRCLWQADAFVSMSRGEGLPVAVLEAMACHCPVLLSDIPPHCEIRGWRLDLVPLFEPDDFHELAGAIDDLAGMPLDILRCWGADCRQHVEWDYSIDRMLTQFELVLDDFVPIDTPEWNAFCSSVRGKRRQRRAA